MKVEYKKGEVVITIPADEKAIKAAKVSGSGKSKILATTSGFKQITGAPAGVKLNMNLLWVIPKDQRKGVKKGKEDKADAVEE